MAKAGTKENRLNSFGELEKLGLNWHEGLDISPEQLYRDSVSKERRDFLGQFFTPEPIAQLMAKWVATNRGGKILDPAVGPGVLAKAIRQQMPDAEITCMDLDPAPIELASTRFPIDKNIEFRCEDFLLAGDSELLDFDGAISNPPYLRHHNFSYDFDIHASIGEKNNVKLSKLSNLYVLFILEICRRLKHGGRAAIIVPSEWVNANFGKTLKEFLHREKLLSKLIYFSHDTLAFDDALTTAAILLIEKGLASSTHLEVFYINQKVSIESLSESLFTSATGPAIKHEFIEWSTLLKTAKWDRLFEMGEHIESENLISVSAVAKSRRGIATGANEFFHIRPLDAATFGIAEKNQIHCVGKSQDVPGLIFSMEDFKSLEEQNAKTRLISFGSEISDSERLYIQKGELDGLPQRFLLASRKPWYSMESRPPASIWAAVFGRRGLRFIWNKANVSNLTTFHCLYPICLSEDEIICTVALLNTAPIQERAMRHRRVYGGGLLKFEPKDLLELEIPDVRTFNETMKQKIINAFFAWDRIIREDAEAPSKELNDLAQELIENGSSHSTTAISLVIEQAELF